MGKPDSIHAAALAEDKFAGIEGKDGIADPCCLAFDFESFVSGHAGRLQLWSRFRETFHTLAFDCFAQAVFRLGIPVTGLQFQEDGSVGEGGGSADHENLEILVRGLDKCDQ